MTTTPIRKLTKAAIASSKRDAFVLALGQVLSEYPEDMGVFLKWYKSKSKNENLRYTDEYSESVSVCQEFEDESDQELRERIADEAAYLEKHFLRVFKAGQEYERGVE